MEKWDSLFLLNHLNTKKGELLAHSLCIHGKVGYIDISISLIVKNNNGPVYCHQMCSIPFARIQEDSDLAREDDDLTVLLLPSAPSLPSLAEQPSLAATCYFPPTAHIGLWQKWQNVYIFLSYFHCCFSHSFYSFF